MVLPAALPTACRGCRVLKAPPAWPGSHTALPWPASGQPDLQPNLHQAGGQPGTSAGSAGPRRGAGLAEMVLLTTDGPRRSNPSQAALHPSALNMGGSCLLLGTLPLVQAEWCLLQGPRGSARPTFVITWVQAEEGHNLSTLRPVWAFSHRCCLYHDCDLRVESVSHHSGQLPPSLCPEVL